VDIVALIINLRPLVAPDAQQAELIQRRIMECSINSQENCLEEISNGVKKMAIQIVADLYGCKDILDDLEAITMIAHKAIDYVGAHIVKECVHKFEPIGVTYFAVISTSHFSVHTWPEYGYAAVDIFSCNDVVADGIAGMLKELFGAEQVVFHQLERKTNNGSE
jgi:S-adenosylmethionine decarboxylase